MNKALTVLCILFAAISTGFSQEKLNDLEVNPVLFTKKSIKPAQHKSAQTTSNLPFFDDFSDGNTYPNSELWINKNTYVNTHYAINPPSIGVATFDAVNEFGYVYESVNENSSPADTLTSKIINMEKANQASTFLSFYFQPQGYGNAPEMADSLVLNIVTKDTSIRIWHSNGTSFNKFINKNYGLDTLYLKDTVMFKLVNLKLDNPLFFVDTFQMQFINYANIPSIASRAADRTNKDHWHIDYVYLNEGRTEADTVFKDIAMIKPAATYLKDYKAMPWSHYPEAIEKQENDVFYYVRNNFDKELAMTAIRMYSRDLTSNKEKEPFNFSRRTLPAASNEEVTTFFEDVVFDWYESDSAIFELSGEIIPAETEDPIFSKNNQTSSIMRFVDYYAYDDGTAEKTYGVDADRAKVACKFRNHKADSLIAVQMYFVRNKEENNAVRNFTFCVWDDYNNKPGDLIYAQTGMRPIITNELNKFSTLYLDTALFIDKGLFYIGWKQNSDKPMNVGYDMNSISRERVFYRVKVEDGAKEDSVWYDSDYNGTIMIRPVFGERELEVPKKSANLKLKVMPNPTTGQIYIMNYDGEEMQGQFHVFDFMGKKLYEQNASSSEAINLSHLNNGMYIVTFFPNNNKPRSTRLLISK